MKPAKKMITAIIFVLRFHNVHLLRTYIFWVADVRYEIFQFVRPQRVTDIVS